MKKTVFRNTPMAVVWLFAGVVGLLAVVVGKGDLNDVVGLTVFGYAAYASLIHYLGVVVDDNAIWMPVPLIPHVPFFVIGRKRVPVTSVGYITSIGHRMGFEAVAIDTVDFVQTVLFTTRDQRRAFFAAMKAARPDILIYRSRGE